MAVLLLFDYVGEDDHVHCTWLEGEVPCLLVNNFPVISIWEHKGFWIVGDGIGYIDGGHMVVHEMIALE